jgi:CHASE1-domain containing sensor protein
MGRGDEWSHVSRVPVLRRLSSALVTLVVLVAGLMLTWVATRAAIDGEKQRAHAELQLLTADIQSAIGDRLLAYEALLRAGAGLLDAFWPASNDDWRRFTAQMRLATVYPGLQGVGFAARNAESGPLATTIVYLEPLDDSNRLALGFDMASEPRRRAAMERAANSGAAALSAKVVLVQDLRRGLHAAGFLLFLPVYSSPNLPATVRERRESLRGFVYGPFRAEDFFRSALAGSAGAAYVEVFDGDSPSAGTLLYRGGTAAPADSTVVTRRLLLAGHHWTLRVSTAAT